jgi:protein gp37
VGETTQIAWTKHTFNPWIGCTKVSPGCDNCYAETLNHRWGKDNWGKGKPRRRTEAANWRQPIKWDKEAAHLGRKDYVFCGSLCDVMDDEAPEGAREDLWRLIDATPNLIWQLLTKRPHCLSGSSRRYDENSLQILPS